MSMQDIGIAEIKRIAYDKAWHEFNVLPGLTPDEKLSGPNKLRWYIQVMADVGECDPVKIAKATLGMMREYEQIVRSKARVDSGPRLQPASAHITTSTRTGKSRYGILRHCAPFMEGDQVAAGFRIVSLQSGQIFIVAGKAEIK